MERCPTCGATYRGGEECGRCGTELGRILAVERAAQRQRREALSALDQGALDRARDSARQACRLHRCPRSLRVAALVSLMDGDFRRAMEFWREVADSDPD